MIGACLQWEPLKKKCFHDIIEKSLVICHFYGLVAQNFPENEFI